MCELLKFLKNKGFSVSQTDHGFQLGTVGNYQFWVADGRVKCFRGCILNLAQPDSLDRLTESLDHCRNLLKCEECPMGGKLPQEISNDLYDHIGWACETKCEDLCGRFGLHHCPLK